MTAACGPATSDRGAGRAPRRWSRLCPQASVRLVRAPPPPAAPRAASPPQGQRCGDGPWRRQVRRSADRVATTSAGVAPSDSGHKMCRRQLHVQPSQRGHPLGVAQKKKRSPHDTGQHVLVQNTCGGCGGRGADSALMTCVYPFDTAAHAPFSGGRSPSTTHSCESSTAPKNSSARCKGLMKAVSRFPRGTPRQYS